MAKTRPFIGLGCFSHSSEVKPLAEVLSANRGVDKDRLLMVTVMMTREILHDHPCPWEDAWPRIEDIAPIFTLDHRVMNTLHYIDTLDDSILMDIIDAVGCCGPNLDAIQLHVDWPAVKDMMTFSDVRPDLKVTLNINSAMIEQADNNPRIVADLLARYNGALDYALLDTRIKKDIYLIADRTLPYLRAIRERIPDLFLAVEGGLGPDTTDLLGPIIEEFPDISVSAFTQVHKFGNPIESIDITRGKLFIERAMQMFSEAKD